jgi:2-polyprenyl-6-methoxyphenol hydroxylase-like FAD-dependent oxidoreductase
MRIVIAGGSMAGLFAGALLHKAGHEVQIFERSHSGLEGRGAGLVAQPDVFDLLGMLGLDSVAQTGVIARERVTLDRHGSVRHRDPRPQLQVSWDHLYSAVRSQLADDLYRTGRAVLGVGDDGSRLSAELEDGARVEGDLVIGADGIGSVIRREILAEDPGPRYAGYVAWRALVPENVLPQLARDALSDRFAFYHMPGGQVLGYTVAGDRGQLEPGARRYNAVWYRRDPDLATTLVDAAGGKHRYSLPPGAVSTQARTALVAAAQAQLPPQFAAIFEAESAPFVQAIFDMETPQMVREKIVLIGDSAFVARPHTAMGVAKAAGDAMALAAAVADGWSPMARIKFERDRLHAGRAIVAYGQRLGASLSG